jgi:chromosome segregation ATPase
MQQNQQKLGWEEKEKTSQALKKYEEARTAMDEVQRKVEQMTAEMQKNNVLSRETLEKYEELQRLMDQLAGPEFAEMMKKLQEAMQQMSPEAMKQALQQFSFSEENFRKSIERTLNLLKRIHIEQKMDEAVRRADEMLKRQEALQEQTKQASQSNPDEMQKLAQEQRELEKNAAALEKEVAGLKSAMEEFPSEMPLADMEQASRELEQSGLEQQMEDIARDLQQMQAR